MDYDAQLFENYRPHLDLPVFRLYQWSPPAISLGRFQKLGEVVNPQACIKDGVEVVSRITGGGAIFHDQELTYSLVCPDDLWSRGGIKESYRALCGFLILTYQHLGLNPVFACESSAPKSSLGVKTPICFSGTESYDIQIEGKKIGGNAQRRKRGVIFQHGSIPLKLDPSRHRKYFLPGVNSLEANAGALLDFCPELGLDDLKKVVKKAFSENLKIQLISGENKGEG